MMHGQKNIKLCPHLDSNALNTKRQFPLQEKEMNC